jgi:uncharacterized protein
MNDGIIFLVGLLAGGVAAVSGFGIGSLLTPLFALRLDVKAAVALVSIPHFVATAYRFWLLRAHIDKRVFWTFGLTSAVGGLAGAYFHTFSGSRTLSLVFGSLLILTAIGQWTGFWSRLRFGPRLGMAAGVVSGFLGGLVGNQGGIRTAAMFGFQVPKEAFVATGTAAALVVDIVRMPIYVRSQKALLGDFIVPAIWVTLGTLLGTWIGVRWLRQIPESIFRRTIAVLLFILGVTMVFK